MRAVTTFAGSSPVSTRKAWAKLWMSRPAPVSSINATATWATTRTPLSARTPRLDDAPRELLWITAARFVRRM